MKINDCNNNNTNVCFVFFVFFIKSKGHVGHLGQKGQVFGHPEAPLSMCMYTLLMHTCVNSDGNITDDNDIILHM